jgi:hypothetical protein
MQNELYSDGISEITVTGPIVRIDFMSLSPQQRDAQNNPTPVFRQRIIMSAEAFANSVDLMRKAVDGLIASGAITKGPAGVRKDGAVHANADIVSIVRNSSPNFS